MSNYEKIKIGTLCKSIVPGRNKPKVFDGDIPWINTPDITNRYIPSSLHETCVSREELKNCGGKTIPSGAVIMACVGDLGLVAIANREIVINQQLHAFICPENVHNEYIAYALEMQKSQMYRLASLTTIPYLNKSNCESLMVPCPPYSMQKRIADLLKQWDTFIEKTEALIAAKERQFIWLKSSLIGEQTSYLSKLGDHFGSSIIVEKGKPLIEANIGENGEIPVIAGGKSSPYSHNQSTHSYPCITISASGAYAGYVWFHDYPIWASDCNVIYSKDHSIEYLYYALKLKQSRIYAFQSGGGQPHVYARDLKNIAIPLPPIEEQKRIAEALNTAQQEINLLNKLADQYRTQKRGLMQKLLSGEWHIKNKEAAQCLKILYKASALTKNIYHKSLHFTS